MHITESAKLGADICSMPMRIIKQMLHHPMTELGMNKLINDRKKVLKK
jgi:transaldolase